MTVERVKENVFQDTIIAGLNAKIALRELNGQQAATIAQYEQAAIFNEKIIASLQAQVALAVPEAWF